MPSNGTSTSGAVTAVDTVLGGALTVPSGRLVDISLYGTLTGGVHIQRNMADPGATANWRTIETLTAAGERVIRNALTRQVRCITASGFSGSVEMVMTVGNRE